MATITDRPLTQPIVPPTPPSTMRLRTYLLLAFLFVSIVPIVLLAFAIATHNARDDEQAARDRVRETALAIQFDIDAHIDEHRRAITVLAGDLERAPADSAVRSAILLQHHRQYPGFYAMIATDAAGTIVAADDYPISNGADLVARRVSVADREYFKAARDTGDLFVSDVFLGRGFGADPIVAVSVPLRGPENRFAGIVEGSLDLRSFRHFEQQYHALRRAEIVILDQHDRVVYASSAAGMKPLESRTGTPMLQAAAAATDPADFYYDRPADPGRARTEYLVSQAKLEATRWRVFVRQPVAVVREETRAFYLLTLFWAGIASALSFLLARLAARRITEPLHVLAGSVHDFQLTGEEKRLDIRRPMPAEVQTLVTGFEEMTGRLSRTLTGLLPICSSCKKIRDDQGHWDHIETFIRSRSEADFTHSICPDCARRLYPDHFNG